MKTDSELWDDTLELIKTKVSPTGYITFFNNVKFLYIKDTTLYLSAVHIIYRDMFEIYQKDTIACIFQTFKRPLSVEILIEEDLPEKDEKAVAVPQAPVRAGDSLLNPKFTFENYIVGSNNQFAYSVAYAITQSDHVNDNYNPLLIYGGSGLGKTHLLHAVGNELLRRSPDKLVVYITSENFVNTFISAIRTENMASFRKKFRTVDLLLIDDIQFFADKTGMQEEFFHTFNELIAQRKQIVLTSDRPPKDINPLEERLRTRLSGGLMTDIQPPDYETRMAILHAKARLNNFTGYIPEDIFDLVAKQIKSNIRELEGAIRTIIAYSDISKKNIDVDTANRLLRDYFIESSRRKIDADYIIKEVEKHFNLKNETIVSQKRDKMYSYPRQIAMYICRELTQLSLPEIGKEFGGRNHATVLHNINKIKEEMENDLNVMNNVNELIKNIGNFDS